MEALVQDLSSGLRQLLRQRGSSSLAVLTLALGIGAATAIFSVIDATLLRPLPYPNPEELVSLSPEELQADGELSQPSPSMADMRAWQAADDVLSLVAAHGGAFRGRIAVGPEPERLQVAHFTEGYLLLHGVTPVIGRDFVHGDTEPGAPLVALLSHGYWRSRYQGRVDVLGESIQLDEEPATIIGVLPAWFNAGAPVSIPLRIPAHEVSRRGTGRVSVIARLRSEVTIEQARARLSAGMTPAPRPDGSTPAVRQVQAVVTSVLESTTARYGTLVGVLGGAVALILLLACVNVGGILLARGAARQTELAVRASMGAGRGRLIRQLLTEHAVLALAGGVIGVALAWLMLDLLVANLPLSMPANAPVTVNVRVLAATLAVLVATVLLFGLFPAVRLADARVGPELVRGQRHAGSALSRRGGQFLVFAEIALAVILVTGAALMIRTVLRISAVDLGFNPDGLLTLQVLPLERNPAAHKDYYAALLQRIRTTPGLAAAGLVDIFPLSGANRGGGVTVRRETVPTSLVEMMPGYLEAMEVRLLQGRLPTDAEYSIGFRGAVINESAARVLFPNGVAIGQTFTRAGRDQQPWTVVGVIADLRHRGPLDQRNLNQPQVFLLFEPSESFDLNQAMMLVIRPDAGLRLTAEHLRELARSIGPRVLVEQIRSGDDWFASRVTTPYRQMTLLSLLGGLGLALSLVGVFGVTAYAVARRTAEIGVRLALGARPVQIVVTVLRDSAAPIGLGVLLGVGGAVMATRAIEAFLFDTSPTDPLTLATVAAILAVSGGLAALVPALRAANVDPVVSLRVE